MKKKVKELTQNFHVIRQNYITHQIFMNLIQNLIECESKNINNLTNFSMFKMIK